MASENWIERQQRMTRCRKHGLHYDPKLASGCYLCLKDAAKRRKPTAPKFLLLLLALFAMALVLFRIFGPKLGPEEEALVGLEIEQTDTNRSLDPEAYRNELLAFEQALFSSPAESLDDLALTSGQIRSSARILEDTLTANDGDSVASAAFRDLARSIPNTLAFTDLERTREAWVQLRDRHLSSASWFYRPSGNGASAQTRAAVAEYLDIARSLLDLLQEGNSQALALADDPSTGDWRGFMEDWRERLNQIAARKLRRPRSGSQSQVLLGFERLEKAFGQAQRLAGSSTAPRDAADAFLRAANQAEEAVDAFEQAR